MNDRIYTIAVGLLMTGLVMSSRQKSSTQTAFPTLLYDTMTVLQNGVRVDAWKMTNETSIPKSVSNKLFIKNYKSTLNPLASVSVIAHDTDGSNSIDRSEKMRETVSFKPNNWRSMFHISREKDSIVVSQSILTSMPVDQPKKAPVKISPNNVTTFYEDIVRLVGTDAEKAGNLVQEQINAASPIVQKRQLQ
jgi:hypothetical protein